MQSANILPFYISLREGGSSRDDFELGKKKLIVFIAAAFLLALGAVFAYRRGLWIPNYPSEEQYPVRGIDVSHHLGSINWNSVRHAGISFVYIKATEGGDLRDSKFQENWRNSDRVGIRRGAYHFFSLKTSGKSQALNFIAMAPKELNELPPAIDLEFGGNSQTRMLVASFQKELSDFVAEIRSYYGIDPVFYTENSFLQRYLVDYPMPRLWIRSILTRPNSTPPWTLWQFSERVKVPGINGFVDQDVFSGSESDFKSMK